MSRANGTFTYFTILETYRRAGRWTEPRVAPFSGRWSDADPHIAPDGAWIYWISNRPLPTDSGDVRKNGRDDYDIWFAERLASGEWGEPRHLGSPVSSRRRRVVALRRRERDPTSAPFAGGKGARIGM